MCSTSKPNQKFILGNYVDFAESLQIEFKEFYLKLDVSAFLNPEEIKHMVLTGELCRGFDEMIFYNLKQYITGYLPKYISSYTNTEDIPEGHFYIGINDFGEITGIPLIEELDESILRSFLENIKPLLCSSLKETNDKNIDILIDSIKIEIIKVEAHTLLLEDDTKRELEEYNYKRNEFKRIYKDYVIKHSSWVEQMLNYATKLTEYVTDRKLRNDIADYILNSPDYKSVVEFGKMNIFTLDGLKLEKTCDKSDLDTIIELLKSSTKIPLYDSIRLAEIKLDSKHVLYWVMIYKDYMTQVIRQQRPTKPFDAFFNEDMFYNNMLRFISKMRYKFLTNSGSKKPKNIEDSPVSQKLNYYVIKFIIPSNVGYEIFYTNLNSEQKWIKKVRGYMCGNVACI